MTQEQPPLRTAAGQAELQQRARGLSPRQRTLLFLVDGRRSTEELARVAAQAGVPERCFEELVALGLIVMPTIDLAHVELPLGTPNDESLLPSAQSLLPESGWAPGPAGASPPTAGDRPLEEARALLLRAVRSEAPVSGLLTLRKLERAAGREEIEGLLDEVEQRIRRPRRLIIAAQTLRHVRHLLGLPPGPQGRSC